MVEMVHSDVLGEGQPWLQPSYCLVTAWLLPGYRLVTAWLPPGYRLVTDQTADLVTVAVAPCETLLMLRIAFCDGHQPGLGQPATEFQIWAWSFVFQITRANQSDALARFTSTVSCRK